MAGRQWTEQQKKAIEYRNCNLLVAAAAGSGKTAVLVERIIRMITVEKIDIDRLLVVTFTSAAAAEMRERISAAILDALEKNPQDEHLSRQMLFMNHAKIMTIHSFCMEVMRSHYNGADIDPAFRVADEIETKLMKSELLDELFEEKYSGEDQNFFDLVERFGEDKKDSRLKELVLQIYEFAQSNPYAEDWIREQTEKFFLPEGTLLEETIWGKVLMETVQEKIAGLKQLCAQMQKLTSQPDGPKKYAPAVLSDMALLEEIEHSCRQGFDQCRDVILRRKFERLATIKSSEEGYDMSERLKQMRDVLKKNLKDMADRYFLQSSESAMADICKLSKVIAHLGDLTIDFLQKYKEEKREKQIADFNDLEHRCLEILYDKDAAGPTKEALSLQEEFEEVLTDEYQDSNLVQEMILSLVSGKGCGAKNRFMVGDVKQSIYRFRLANPGIFIEKYHSYSTDKSQQDIRIDLFQNFRSRKEVLDGINFVFRQVMSEAVGEIVYDEAASLHCGQTFDPPEAQVTYGGPVELMLLDYKKEEEAEFEVEEDEEDVTNIQMEIACIIQKVKELTESFYIQDKETKQYRLARYEDIVILMRSPSGWSKELLEQMTNAGIPAYAETRTGFFRTIEIMTMVNLLRVLDNPREDIPLLAVLRSPIYGFTSDELLKIRLHSEKEEIYQCLVNFFRDCPEDGCAKKLEKFFSDLTRWREYVIHLPLEELIETLYQQTGYFDYVGAMAGGKIRQANLRILAELAVQYESTSYQGLFYFVKYIGKIEENQTDTGSAKLLGENGSMVRIMSIHKSKGLEFPIVIVAGMGKRFHKKDLEKNILLHQEMGFGAKYFDYEKRLRYPTLTHTAVAEVLKRELLSEEMRVLYVAMTRAKEKLILCGGVNHLSNALRQWTSYVARKEVGLPLMAVGSANCYLDWVVPAVAGHRDGEVLCDLSQTLLLDQNNGIYTDPSRWKVEIIRRSEIREQSDRQEQAQIAHVEELEHWEDQKDYSGKREEIFRKLRMQYPFEQEALLPANISISEIRRIYQRERFSQDENLQESRGKLSFPAFTQQRHGLTGAEKGTILHMVMERLDFTKQYTQEEIRAFVESLQKSGVLTVEEAKSVYIKQIAEFFQSKIYGEIRRADRFWKEQPFAMELSAKDIYPNYTGTEEGIMVHGIIDCFYLSKGKIKVLDYKTDYFPGISEAYFLQTYQVQMGIYCQAVQRMAGFPVEGGYIYSFALKDTIQIC